MQSDLLASLRRLSDADLVARIEDISARERGATALLVAHLSELDTRDAHLRAGHGSLFAYCRSVLALSEHEAYNRVAAARAVRRFPGVLSLLEEGAVNLTTVKLLAPHLTPDNHREVLESARGKSKLQVEEIAARLWPRRDVPSFVRKLPPSKPFASAPTLMPAPVNSSPAGVAPTHPTPSSAPAVPSRLNPAPPPSAQSPPRVDSDPPPVSTFPARPALPARPPAEVTPLSPDRYRVQVTIGGDTLEKLRLAKDLLRHAVPSGDEAAILDRALTALLADLAQRKFAATERPRPSGDPSPGSRHVPAEVKRAVWLRDLGRCAFVGTSGRCNERGFLEFHHVHPYALGGAATVQNIQLRCRAHNDYESRVEFGRADRHGGDGLVREHAAPYGASSFRDDRRGVSRPVA